MICKYGNSKMVEKVYMQKCHALNLDSDNSNVKI